MKIKSIIFDLDGVLIDSKNIHFEALNIALGIYAPSKNISLDDHLKKFDGLSTRKKIEILEKEGLDKNLKHKIIEKKNEMTSKLLEEKIFFDKDIFEIFKALKLRGYNLSIATNAIRETLEKVIFKLRIKNFFPCGEGAGYAGGIVSAAIDGQKVAEKI